MRWQTLLVLLLLCAARPGFGQEKVDLTRFGLIGGQNSSHLSSEDTRSRSRAGFVGGVALIKPMWRFAALQLELLSSTKGYTGNSGERLRYVELPVLFRIGNPSQRSILPFAYAGLAPEFHWSCQAWNVPSLGSGANVTGDCADVHPYTVPHKFNVAAIAGWGVSISDKQGRTLTFGGRWDVNAIPIMTNSFLGELATTSLMVGVEIPRHLRTWAPPPPRPHRPTPGYQWSVLAGYNHAWVAAPHASSDPIGGSTWGAGFIHPLTASSAIEVEGLYAFKGYRDGLSPPSLQERWSFVELPLLYRHAMGSLWSATAFWYAGPALALNTGCQARRGGGDFGACGPINGQGSAVATNVDGVLGAGFAIPTRFGGAATIGARFTQGLRPLVADESRLPRTSALLVGFETRAR